MTHEKGVTMHTPLFKTVIAVSLALMGTSAMAQTTATGGSTSTEGAQSAQTVIASPAQASTAADKIIAQFTAFSGSGENASSLVNGLRTGSEITLNGPTASGSTGGTSGTSTGTTSSSSASFTPPTKPMGYGNIRIALSLARAQLGADGISQPTPEQLQTALMGDASGSASGTTTQTQGILQMRASGMGWGQIANSMGFKLGTVMSGRVPAPVNADTTPAQSGTGSVTTTATGAGTGPQGKGGSGSIVTATGAPAGGNSSKNFKGGTSKGSNGNAARSGGIFTAAGDSLGGQGGRSHHAVSAAGNASGNAAIHGGTGGSSSGAVSAGGGGRANGNAYGHSK